MWPVPLCKIWVHIWISHPHIAYSLWHFYWATMKIKVCLLVSPPILNAKSSENFVPTKIGQILAVLGVWGSGVSKSSRFLLQKARPCVNPRRLSHFASKSVEGCDLQVGWGKNRESHRESHRKDMSPLTQGLKYRSACDRPTYTRFRLVPKSMTFNDLWARFKVIDAINAAKRRRRTYSVQCTYLLTYLHSWLGAYKTGNISETVEDRAKLIVNGRYKIVHGFRLPPKCITLSDLWARFKVIDSLNAAKWRNLA